MLKQMELKGYSIEEFAPELVVIGSDRGGTAFGYDFRSETPKLFEVDFIGLNIDTPFYSTEEFFDLFNTYTMIIMKTNKLLLK